ncbi:MAG TPA: ferrochelatase [Chloroflexota bacterium]|nr:ferrochelatase [Chloroflexota bacterium]
MIEMTAPTGVLLMAYGTPATLDDVEPYYTHIRGGRPPTPEAVQSLKNRYSLIGGRSPLLGLTLGVASSLEKRLDADRFGRFRVYVGMKHWHPFIGDVVPQMAVDGVRQAIAIVLAPHYSRMSIGTYRKALDEAQARLERPLDVHFVESWHAHPLFRRLIANRILSAMSLFPAEARQKVAVLFSAHSLPERITTWDDPYPRELHESAAGIAQLVGLEEWHFAFQSAGRTPEPWLGPDILDALADLAARDTRHVLSVPFGFVADHLEVLFDIDVEAQARAAELGLMLRRTESPNADPAFVEILASIVAERVTNASAPSGTRQG